MYICQVGVSVRFLPLVAKKRPDCTALEFTIQINSCLKKIRCKPVFAGQQLDEFAKNVFFPKRSFVIAYITHKENINNKNILIIDVAISFNICHFSHHYWGVCTLTYFNEEYLTFVAYILLDKCSLES